MRSTIGDRVPLETKLDYARPRLVVAPYDSDNWRKYASVPKQIYHDNGSGEPSFVKFEDFYIKRIVYSRHDTGLIQQYMSDKFWMLERLHKAEEMDLGEGWTVVRANIDEDRDLICPLIRAKRLAEYLNIQNGDSSDKGLTALKVTN
ncbi:MAG: hypothetical protein ACI92Z_003551 [Paracoccaceae bacterium]|jgi:hypothetical protein